MGMTITQPMGDILKTIESMPKEIRTNSQKILKICAVDMVELAQAYGAVDTGEMIGSVMFDETEDIISVTSQSEQGFYNEYGTTRMPIGDVVNPLAIVSTSGKPAYRPWFRPAYYQVLQNFEEIVRQVFRRRN